MRLIIDIDVDQPTLDAARDRGKAAYLEMLADLAEELHEIIEHAWDDDGWFRIRRIQTHAAPKDLLHVRNGTAIVQRPTTTN